MELNSEYIQEHYIEMYERIITEPTVMPRLINRNTDDDSNSLGYELILKIQDVKISPEVLNVKNRKREEIRRFEEDTLKNYSEVKAWKIIQEFHENELREFLEEYPEYSEVLLKDNISKRVLSFIKK